MADKEVAKDVLKEKPKTLAQAMEFAVTDRNLIGALKGPKKVSSGTVRTIQEETPSSKVSDEDMSLNQESKARIRKAKAAKARGEALCFGCGKSGHIKPNCPYKQTLQDIFQRYDPEKLAELIRRDRTGKKGRDQRSSSDERTSPPKRSENGRRGDSPGKPWKERRKNGGGKSSINTLNDKAKKEFADELEERIMRAIASSKASSPVSSKSEVSQRSDSTN